MTDLILFKGKWFCAFRESDSHVGGTEGRIRILESHDTLTWSSQALLAEEGVDLRDPKFSITPTGDLMLLVGGTIYQAKKYQSLRSRVSFSKDGKNWQPFTEVLSPHEWLWRVTWHHGKAYGVAYSRSDPKDASKPWNIKLYESGDGIHYNLLTIWDIPGHPNETTLRFLKSGQMLALVRRDGKEDRRAWIGISNPPFEEWQWQVNPFYFGGPNFIILPDDLIITTGRILLDTPYIQFEKTVVGNMDLKKIYPALILPSGGDCSYPGMVYYQNILWISYYSSHEDHSSIYLARVAI